MLSVLVHYGWVAVQVVMYLGLMGILIYVAVGNDGWPLFLGLSAMSAVLLMVGMMAAEVLFHTDLPDVVVGVIIGIPWAGMVIYQALAVRRIVRLRGQ